MNNLCIFINCSFLVLHEYYWGSKKMLTEWSKCVTQVDLGILSLISVICTKS